MHKVPSQVTSQNSYTAVGDRKGGGEGTEAPRLTLSKR